MPSEPNAKTFTDLIGVCIRAIIQYLRELNLSQSIVTYPLPIARSLVLVLCRISVKVQNLNNHLCNPLLETSQKTVVSVMISLSNYLMR